MLLINGKPVLLYCFTEIFLLGNGKRAAHYVMSLVPLDLARNTCVTDIVERMSFSNPTQSRRYEEAHMDKGTNCDKMFMLPSLVGSGGEKMALHVLVLQWLTYFMCTINQKIQFGGSKKSDMIMEPV